MKKRIGNFTLLLCLTCNVLAQTTTKKVFTSDIDNFWNAFDSIQTTKDSAQQIQYIKSLYINKATVGLKAFMVVRENSAEKWVRLINSSPKFWASIRPNTLTVKDKAAMIESSIAQLKELYPELTEAKMYFTIGSLNSGGTTVNNMILIGSEIGTGTPSTDVSDLPESTGRWLGAVFKEQNLDNIIPLNIHEYIHTQQNGSPRNLLSQCIHEGACDFITELVIGKPMQNNYIQYGRIHEKELKEQFKHEMFTSFTSNWLYNGSSTKSVGDLGYFMGYTICKSYYEHSADKKRAIKEIIEINASDSNAIDNFLAKSKYYNETINKTELVNQFESKRPLVVSIDAVSKGDSTVMANVKELQIQFSKPMKPNQYSMNHGAKAKDADPIRGVVGFSEDAKTFTIKVELQPNQEYEFFLTDRAFISMEGYPLKPYFVKFKTK